MLFAAARSDHVEKRIRPAVDAGIWVVSDRFLDSSRAYQGASLGLSDAVIMDLHRIGSGGYLPDRTIILDLPLEASRQRTQARDGDATDRIGGRNDAFHLRVRDAFHHIADLPNRRVCAWSTRSGTPEEVSDRILAEIADLLP
jgi:dTMP kinase